MNKKVSQFEMSKKTKKKALDLCNAIKRDVEINCFFVALDDNTKLLKMLKRHLKKELK